MDKKDLQSYLWLKKNIKHLEDQLLALETEATRMTARYDGQPRSGANQGKDRLHSLVTKMVEVQEEINKKLQESYCWLKQIEHAIESLPEREQYLMRMRYIEGKSWEKIAVDMNYCWRQVHHIHAQALKRLHTIARNNMV